MPLLERLAHPIHGGRRRKDRLRQAKMVDPNRGLHVHTEGEPQRPLYRPMIDPSDGLPSHARAQDLENHMPAGVPPERSTDLVPRPVDEVSRAEGVHVGLDVGSAVDVRVEEGAVTATVPTPEGTIEELVVLEKKDLGTTVYSTHVDQSIIHEEHIDKEFVHEHHVTQEIVHEHHIDQPVIHEKHIEVPVVHEKHIEKPVIHEKHIERPVIHEKHIEQPIIHEKHIEQPIIHEKHIEQPIIHEKHIEQPIIHEKHIEKPIIHEKHIEQPVIHERHIEKPVVHETHVEKVVVHQVHHVQPIVHQTHVNEKTIAEHVVAPTIVEKVVLREESALDVDERTAPRIVEQTNETASAIIKVEKDLESIEKANLMESTIIEEVIREDGGVLPPTIIREEGVIDTARIVRDVTLANEQVIVDTGKIRETLPAEVVRLDEVVAAKVVLEKGLEKPVVVTDTELKPPVFLQETDTLKASFTSESTTLPVEIVQEGYHHHHDGLAMTGANASRVDATVLRPDIPPTVVASAPVGNLDVPAAQIKTYENPLTPPALVMDTQHQEHHGLKDRMKDSLNTISHPIDHHQEKIEEPVAVLPV